MPAGTALFAWRSRTIPDLADRVGVFDETVAGDMLGRLQPVAGAAMSPSDGSLSGRQPKAVQSALRVLEEVARAGVGVTAKEIAEHLSTALGDHLSATESACGRRLYRAAAGPDRVLARARGWRC